jgi:uncharacterized protein involved in outer membrane biogenesis
MTPGAASDRARPAELDSAPAEPAPGLPTRRRFPRLILILAIVVILAAAVVLPPLININRYHRQITALIAQSLGRPVRLSSVELRLLPMPGFVLNDFSVSEDPAFGAEPVLSARTVVASVAILPLWRGRLRISRISVDEASLNLVRMPQGRWNLETLMTGNAQPALTGASRPAEGSPQTFPYLEATNSRVNWKKGLEKTPYSIVNTDLSLWQQQPGEWRVRLRGQPLRSDLSLSREADSGAGEIRLEASLHSAAQLRDMPVKLEVEWRDAQLGQLSRLILGSDAGWRGDLTANLKVEGTAESAHTIARLQATGVRREEFAPPTPLDFDANCGFTYQHSHAAVRNVDCGTALGSGRLHLVADLPGALANAGETPHAQLDVKDVPVQAGLDLLRTLRSGFAPGMEARGTVNGSLTYRRPQADTVPIPRPARHSGKGKSAARAPAEPPTGNLQGSLVMDGAQLRGGTLQEPLIFPKSTWTPVTGLAIAQTAIGARLAIPMSSTAVASTSSIAVPAPAALQPLQLRVAFTRSGYDAAVGGSASLARLRTVATALGVPSLAAADQFTAGTADLNLTASGPWLAPEPAAPTQLSDGQANSAIASASPSDIFRGSLELHHARWQVPYLARPLELTQADVILAPTGTSLDGDFAYSTLKGTLSVTMPDPCPAPDCHPDVALHFAALDAAAVQAALLGVPEQKSLLTPIIDQVDRMRSTQKPEWPAFAVAITADSLAAGPLNGPLALAKPAMRIHFDAGKVVIDNLDAVLLGGSLHATGGFDLKGKAPQYVLTGDFTGVSAEKLGSLLNAEFTGGLLSGTGTIQLSGSDATALAASAKGEIHFAWKRGGITGVNAHLDHFETWTGTVAIASDAAQLGKNDIVSNRHHSFVAATIPFTDTPTLAITSPANPAAPAMVAAPQTSPVTPQGSTSAPPEP